jgi:hypothetical protein
MLWKALVIWFVQLVVVILLGALRQKLLEPIIGEHRAHQIGTIVACVIFLVLFCAVLPWLAPASHLQALGVGLFWLLLALAFEFGFFHYVAGKPWSELLSDYNVAEGRLLVLLWIIVALGPLLCFGVHHRP